MRRFESMTKAVVSEIVDDMIELEERQESYKNKESNEELSVTQQCLLNVLVISWNDNKWELKLESLFSASFLMHIGRILCYNNIPDSNSWQHAGSSYMLRVLCSVLSSGVKQFLDIIRLVNDPTKFQETTTSTSNSKIEQIDDNNNHEVLSSTVVSYSKDKSEAIPRLLKLCVYKVWAEHCERTNIFNSTILMTKIGDAIELYNTHCKEWDSSPIENNIENHSAITKTANGSSTTSGVQNTASLFDLPGSMPSSPVTPRLLPVWIFKNPSSPGSPQEACWFPSGART